MRISVDLGQWIAHALRGSPALDSGLLDFCPAIWLKEHASVYDALQAALPGITAAIINDDIREECDRALNPLRSIWDQWVLGCPVEIFADTRAVHFIDAIEEIGADHAQAPVLLVQPRPGFRENQTWLRAIGEKFIGATGLRGLLHGTPYFCAVASVMDYLAQHQELANMLTRPTVYGMDAVEEGEFLAEAQELPELLNAVAGQSRVAQTSAVTLVRDAVASQLDEAFIGAIGIVPMVLSRAEAVAYNEFSMIFGPQFVQNALVPFMYTSRLWDAVAKSEGPILLSEIASRIWRFSAIRERIRKTREA